MYFLTNGIRCHCTEDQARLTHCWLDVAWELQRQQRAFVGGRRELRGLVHVSNEVI
jgi:hypothetical protein